METEMRGRCPVPILTTRGQVALEISTDNMTWEHETQITISKSVYFQVLGLPQTVLVLDSCVYQLYL